MKKEIKLAKQYRAIVERSYFVADSIDRLSEKIGATHANGDCFPPRVITVSEINSGECMGAKKLAEFNDAVRVPWIIKQPYFQAIFFPNGLPLTHKSNWFNPKLAETKPIKRKLKTKEK